MLEVSDTTLRKDRNVKLPIYARLGIPEGKAGFMGDDLIDLPVLRRCGFACAPPGAHELVRNRVQYVAQAPAGAGAAREVCDLLMRSQGNLEAALARYLA